MLKTMKKNSLLILLLLVISSTFAQKVIESPQYEISTFPGEIRKIELTKSATILHFHLHSKPNGAIYIPKGSCIKEAGTDEKLFVTKTEGIPLNKKYKLNDSGIANYKLHFPPLKKDIGKIDFSESNKGGSWHVYDIVIDETKYGSLLPRELKGNWLKTDGSNAWKYGFYNNRAVIDKKIWTYKSVKEKRKSFELVLESSGKVKTVFAKLNKDKTFSFGLHKKQMVVCSLKTTHNKNYKLKDDVPYSENNLFVLDSTEYSGIIRSVHKGSKSKTGMVYVRNIFTGNQESYLVKISEDGGFSVKFPLYHPQQVYVRLPGYSGNVFFEPGKETWQLINSSKRGDVFFAGDCAQVNSDLSRVQYIMRHKGIRSLRTKSLDLTKEEFKKRVHEIYKQQISKLDLETENRFFSAKANQIMRLDIEYQYYQYLLSYDMYRRKDHKPEIDMEYLNFLTPEVYNNKLAVMCSSYSSFVNYLSSCEPLQLKTSLEQPQVFELADMLVSEGVKLTEEEKELVKIQKKGSIENAVSIKKQKSFRTQNKNVLWEYERKIQKLYKKLPAEEQMKLFSGYEEDIDVVVALAAKREIKFSVEEIQVRKAYKNVLNKREIENIRKFNTDELKAKKMSFNKKYNTTLRKYFKNKFRELRITNLKTFFKDDNYWVANVIVSQNSSRNIKETLTPLDADELADRLNNIKDPFIAKYLVYENNRTLKKIKKNKNASGFVLNKVPKTEADKLFDKIISKYKGKVILVDFWATWCAPCRSGIKKMIPLKEELKDKDVVFLYITDQTSPEKTYNNMIPEIKGEHYRVTTDEWNYLKIKFNISGIPHYSLIDKMGNLVENKIRLQTNEGYKKLIKDHLN
jgi:thiol-disulfide isomerase/thioredoxin